MRPSKARLRAPFPALEKERGREPTSDVPGTGCRLSIPEVPQKRWSETSALPVRRVPVVASRHPAREARVVPAAVQPDL
jgi:hypothetical protein